MESYCVFLMGSFVAMNEFQKNFGIPNPDVPGAYVIVSSWQSALQVGGPLGALIGVTIAGPITSRVGYRWATIGGLMLLNAFIFIFYFANSLAVMFVAQLMEGIPWGIFIANAPAYCSEIVPIKLRAPATQMLQMFWAIGSIIVGGVCYVYQGKNDPTSYRFVSLASLISVDLLLTSILGSPSPFSGCSRPLWPFSSFSRPSHPGGWFERAVMSRLRSRLCASGVGQS
jgi:MFS transporter, SP family, general alpha glucoside:H+ symporter